MSNMTIAQGAAARALWVSGWANYEEQHGRGHGGQQLMDIAPTTPLAAKSAAKALITRIEAMNGASIETLIKRAWKKDGYEGTPNTSYIVDFGHYLGMMALGHGVSWFDDHAEFPLKMPDIEVLVYKYKDSLKQRRWYFGTNGLGL